ncbi:2-oxo-4-hydroxy-4-carboxy-5-ureidoimidazoline decarboxylase [Sporolactobacillus kofuensis]|uniref:2-oxo-4-hydroxy-4-carboxy-5-ureidoimidazoline decarboxylase n=1 Tax=Sporolactobacillus kofuensis TaxID=269672 RepID=A0ABW1WC86_9BACL|nr:2-oxo-4-hydroxy-4-carboxy-5-ureidoimidazoline decarboxylase [Sporolactobacillus kofuensis]MCO7175025.1 2-oxo-4-hydroxy-4-carboxy-5-ureidoimidazoline decarboxylase [Sporolactobacillus kofuensis]
MKLETLNRADSDHFVELLDGVFEHAPWIVKKIDHLRPFSSIDTLFRAIASALTTASYEQKEALINAHPRLGSSGKMTERSTREQQQAGLQNMEEEEATAFAKLNADYEKRFDLPFIMAVRGKTKSEIYAAMEKRIHNTKKKEFETAIDEILKITRFRLDDLLHEE